MLKPIEMSEYDSNGTFVRKVIRYFHISWVINYEGYRIEYIYIPLLESLKLDTKNLVMSLLVEYNLVELKPIPEELFSQIPRDSRAFVNSKDIVEVEKLFLEKEIS